MPNAINCWNCGKGTEEVHFCDACQSLQPPTSEYYDFFNLEHKLNLDTGDLERRFYTLSRRLHPDVYFRRSPQERQYSLDATAILNDAYRTLRNPISRAEYLLKQNGFETNDQKVPPELLEEVFELKMALEEFREGDLSVRPQLEAARDRLYTERDQVDTELNAAFEEYDRAGETAVLARIRGILNHRKYIQNLTAEVERELV